MPRHRILSQHRHSTRTRLLPRFTFRNFAYLVFALIIFAYFPFIYQRFSQKTAQIDCEWLKMPPMICAHGGDSSRAPPNTRAAYQLAIAVGVDCIEIDASRTRDGVLVALHDRDLQKMSQRNGIRVGDLTANEIIKLDPTLGFPERFSEQRVPTLEDAIQFVQQSLKQIIIDAKVGPPLFQEGLSTDLIDVMKKTECKHCLIWAKEDKVIGEITSQLSTTKMDRGTIASGVGCFLMNIPTELKCCSLGSQTGYIVLNDTTTGKVSQLVRLEGTEVVGIYYGLVTSKVVNVLHRAGKKVHAWTVNDDDGMVGMLKSGVDAIITNNPNLLQLVMREQRKLCILNGATGF